MLVVIGGIKGGSGKSTLATNFTLMRSSQRKKVLLVDTDEQSRSVTEWVEQRDGLGLPINWTTIQLSGQSIYIQLKKLSSDYDDIIVDVGGVDSTSQRAALIMANVFLVPFKPSSFDIWTVGKVRKLISEVTSVNPNLKSYALINQADPFGSDNQDAIEILSEYAELICLEESIGYRKAFRNASNQGLGIIEMKPQDKKASLELKSIYDIIYN